MSTKDELVQRMEALLEAYGDDRLGREYGYRDPEVYTLTGYHRAQDIRKQEGVYPHNYSVVTDVLSLSAGRVVYVGRPNGVVGLTVVIDTARERGRFESHSHMAGLVIGIGDEVGAGQKIGRNAAANENPGTGWGGPHDHFAITDHVDGAWQKRPEYNPLPFIKEARFAARAAIEATKPGEVYVVTTATYLRSEQTTVSASKIMRLAVGRKLRVLSIDGDWATVQRINGDTAYVYAARLTKAKLTATVETVLRRSPTKASAAVLKLAKGKRVNVIGRRIGNRVKVERAGRVGWAYRKHVQ